MEKTYLKYLSQLKDLVTVDTNDEHILRIERTDKIPFVFLNRREGILIFFGRLLGASPNDFYRSILDFIDSPYGDISKITIYFRVEYINTSSSKAFYDFLKSLNALFFSGKEMNILWFQDGDDPDPYIDGEDLHYFVKIPFDIIELTQDQIKELEAFISQL